MATEAGHLEGCRDRSLPDGFFHSMSTVGLYLSCLPVSPTVTNFLFILLHLPSICSQLPTPPPAISFIGVWPIAVCDPQLLHANIFCLSIGTRDLVHSPIANSQSNHHIHSKYMSQLRCHSHLTYKNTLLGCQGNLCGTSVNTCDPLICYLSNSLVPSFSYPARGCFSILALWHSGVTMQLSVANKVQTVSGDNSKTQGLKHFCVLARCYGLGSRDSQKC